MKKVLLTAVMTVALASGLKASDYKAASSQARQSLKELESSVSVTASSAVTVTAQYKALAEIATTEENKAWALNNAGYANIVLFKKLVNYDAANTAINALNPKSKERTAAVKALQSEYIKYKNLLEEISLDDAIRISQNLGNKRQWNALVSNRQFVTDSLIFIDEKF